MLVCKKLVYCSLHKSITDKIDCESGKSKDLVQRRKKPNEKRTKLLWYNYSFKIATY